MSLMELDITKAFLESPLEDEVYINYPHGYKDIKGSSINKSTCLKINKSVYGLVQASKCFYNRLTKYMTIEMGYIISDIETFLLKKIGRKYESKLMTGVYFDDILLFVNS